VPRYFTRRVARRVEARAQVRAEDVRRGRPFTAPDRSSGRMRAAPRDS
jgi:hypothetical protein